jgi:hypothetical protein
VLSAGKAFGSVRKHVTLMTRSRLLPASSSTAFRFANACRACVSKESPVTLPVTGSIPAGLSVHEVAARTAVEADPRDGGLSIISMPVPYAEVGSIER